MFRLGDVVYRVERVVAGSARLWIGEADEPETTAVRTTNKRLVQELDMTWEVFQRTVFARQKDVAALDPSGSTDKRRSHVEKLLGLKRYREAAVNARDHVKELDAELRGLREGAPDLTSLRAELAEASELAAAVDPDVLDVEITLGEAKLELAELERQLDEARRLAASFAALTGRQASARKLIDQLAERLQARKVRAAERAAKIEELADLDGHRDDPIAAAEARRAWDDAQVRHAALAALRKQAPEGTFDPEAAAARAARLEAVRVELDELHRNPPPPTDSLEQRVDALALAQAAGSVADARARLDAADALRDELRERVAVLDGQLARDREHVDALARGGPDVPCSVCLRPYGEGFATILEAQRASAEASSAELHSRRGLLQEHETERTAAARAHRAAERAAETLARTSGPDDPGAARAALAQAHAAVNGHAARLARLEEERRDLDPAVVADRNAERATAEHRGRLAECRVQLTSALDRLGKAGYDAEAHGAAVRRHDHAVAVGSMQLTLGAEIEASTGIEDEVVSLEGELAAAQAERAGAVAELQALSFDAELEQLLHDRRGHATQAKEEAIELLGAARAAARAKDERVRELTTRLEDAEAAHARIAEQERSLREHDVAAGILTGFRMAQNERAWPRLQKGAGALLSETTAGRYVDVRLSPDYKLAIVDRGEEHALERYSGGEQDLANLCLRLAIADWVARERGVEMGFVVLDEVFGSQDEERRHRLVDELRTIANRFHQLLLITHAPEIAELCEHQIRVVLEEPGRSTAEIVGIGGARDAVIA